jgi:hypothetical protein
MVEGRWLRNPQYVKDLVQLYTRGGVEIVSGITYTHYIHRAIYEYAQATGDAAWLVSQLSGMVKTFDLWNTQFDNSTGLYHRTPLLDAQEYSLPGYVVGGPNGSAVQQWDSSENNFQLIWLGPETYRPNFNAYMVAGAGAIATVAQMAGENTTAQQWATRASTLYSKMTSLLYNSSLNFWIDVIQINKIPAIGRQLIGYFPWRFGVGVNPTIQQGLEAGLTPRDFVTAFGPTTLEQSNPYFTADKNSTYCCIWQGQSWPFSTSVYLRTLASLARGIPGATSPSNVSTADFFYNALLTYARTNYKDGIPYTAESHYPAIDMWSGDSTNHSEHYLHSTYLDNIFVDLLGVLPTLDDRLELSPLIPKNWSYFAVENLPYHGLFFAT